MVIVEKEAVVQEVADKIRDSKSVFLTDFTGLNVKEISNLRRSFREASVEYKVVKNTLTRLSAKAAGFEELSSFLEGPTALAFGLDDPTAPAKVIREFTKKADKVKVKACLFEGTLIGSADQLNRLADLPSRPEIIGTLAGVLNAPISNLACALNGVLTQVLYALNAVKDKKEKNS
jgi:large subunit ribosomal protein L10